ncbi:nitroreductase/quinone reductase family protein [Actinacidiphila acididurans]|uniref:Nitroreductase family deazaflavin-dependent oxidoreductase n=1 Tax=Actinacidiphila acididurans TaxID=2784346 RepID=A0ABS2TY09_9ACTN|nr:nitroreductase/quinone reductase family protein [Actinacidiphila acididurans]MBM9508204.1 nitroreductase family deazaflavin-dependent oxidoreductase [Actinacidiphila acididurans]
MSADTRPPISASLRIRNKIMETFQRLGLPVGPIHLLKVRGRKSGKEYSNPVAPVEIAGTQYVLQAFPESDWVKNVRAAGEGVMVRGRKHWHVRLEEVPLSERGPIVRELPKQVPMGVGIYVKNGVVEDASPEAFERAAPRIPVFRVVPD